MKIEAIGTGATIDEARENAVKELNAPANADVHTEIVAYPQKKILGLFGGNPAKVRAYVEALDNKPAKKQVEKKPADKKSAEQKAAYQAILELKKE